MANIDLKLEIVVIPVSDVDRTKEFYAQLGWRLDADFDSGNDFRVIQFTPPGSGCSIIFGENVTATPPGSAQGLYLIVSDIQAARAELLGKGVAISEVFHDSAGEYAGPDEPYLFGRLRVSGPAAEPASYHSFASFHDPDGNGWLLQEVTTRAPGRIETRRPSHPSPTLRARFVGPGPRMESMRSGPAGSTTRTGRSGTPSTSCASSQVKNCRSESQSVGCVVSTLTAAGSDSGSGSARRAARRLGSDRSRERRQAGR